MKNVCVLLASVATAVCLFVVVAPSKAAVPQEQVTITGVVRVAAMNSHGKILSVYIDTQDEEIFVSAKEKGKELLKQVRATVSVTGYLRRSQTTKDFDKVIDVIDYTVEKAATPKPPKLEEKSSE